MSVEVTASNGVTVDSNVATRTVTLPFYETDAVPAACSYPGCRSAVSPHYSPHLIEAPYIEKLRAEAAALKAELRRQWEYNHSEHCSNDWPHPAGLTCHWPLPVELQ